MKQSAKLSVFGLAMLNVAAVLSLRGLPIMAETGLQMFFYLAFASLLFLIPCSLISAELASGWPEEGGVYLWVKEAFGAKWGFMAIWLQWIQNVIWFPVILAFAASSFAYILLAPELASNHYYSVFFINFVYWLATYTTFKGLKTVEKLTSFAVIGGTIIPVTLVIILGLIWFFVGEPLNIFASTQSFLPDFTEFSNVSFLAGIVLLFAGMEVGAVHVRNLKNPRQDYPKTLLIALIIIVTVFSLGSFAVALVLPAKEISLTAGLLQTFDKMLAFYHLHAMLPVMGFLISFGAIGGVMAWMSGPSKGLLATAKHGELPPFLSKTNQQGIQTHILYLQGFFVTLLTSLYLIMDNVNTAFFLLSAMTVALYLLMYILVFLAGIRLRYVKPDVYRAYRIPYGNVGIWITALCGLSAVSFAFILAFFPPTELHVANPKLYVTVVSGGVIMFSLMPLIIQQLKKPEWRRQSQK